MRALAPFCIVLLISLGDTFWKKPRRPAWQQAVTPGPWQPVTDRYGKLVTHGQPITDRYGNVVTPGPWQPITDRYGKLVTHGQPITDRYGNVVTTRKTRQPWQPVRNNYGNVITPGPWQPITDRYGNVITPGPWQPITDRYGNVITPGPWQPITDRYGNVITPGPWQPITDRHGKLVTTRKSWQPGAGGQAITTQLEPCPPGAKATTAFCLMLHSELLTFHQAEQACKQKYPGYDGAHLAYFDREQGYTYVRNLFRRTLMDAWVGLNRYNADFEWRFSDGTEFSWRPNDWQMILGSLSENRTDLCARVNLYVVMDVECTARFPYFCQNIRGCRDMQGSMISGDKCYTLHLDHLTFNGADAACHSRSGELASFHNYTQFLALRNMASYAWVGMYSVSVGGTEYWKFTAPLRNGVHRYYLDDNPDYDQLRKAKDTEKCATVGSRLNPAACELKYPFFCLYRRRTVNPAEPTTSTTTTTTSPPSTQPTGCSEVQDECVAQLRRTSGSDPCKDENVRRSCRVTCNICQKPDLPYVTCDTTSPDSVRNGWTLGRQCSFPFTYRSRNHLQCTTESRSDESTRGRSWCCVGAGDGSQCDWGYCKVPTDKTCSTEYYNSETETWGCFNHADCAVTLRDAAQSNDAPCEVPSVRDACRVTCNLCGLREYYCEENPAAHRKCCTPEEARDRACLHGGFCQVLELEAPQGHTARNVTCQCPQEFEGVRCEYQSVEQL